MKNSKELVEYTLKNTGAMRSWYNNLCQYVEKFLKSWINDYHISNKKDNESVRNFVAYSLDGKAIIYNYSIALLKCNEEFTTDTIIGAIDILLQEMAKNLSYHMHNQYPCLQNHYVVMRANKFKE